MSIRLGVLALMLALAACRQGNGDAPPDGPPGTPDSGTRDAGSPDSGTRDAGTPDSGTPDSGTPDSGTPDSGTPDSGISIGCFHAPQDPGRDAEWGFLLGTRKSEEFLDVAVNTQGLLYLAGYVNGDVGVARIDPSGDSKGLLVRVGYATSDNAMFQYWDKYFDTLGSTETVDALAFHPTTGALYFAGRTTGAFNRSNGAVADFSNQGQQDIFVGGPNGNSRDVILYQGGTVRPQHPNRLAFDSLGHLVVSGFDDIYVPTGTNYVDQWEDSFVTSLQRATDQGPLAARWTWSANTTFADVSSGLAVNPGGDHGIYVTGNNGGGPSNQKGAFVRKFDNTSGNAGAFWQQSRISMDTIQAAHFLADGNLLIGGTTFGVMGEKSYGEQDVVLRVLNMDPNKGQVGAPVWTKQYGSPGSDFLTDMAVDAAGNIVVVGETLDSVIDGDPSAYKGSYDVFMMKFNARGERQDVRQWGSPGDDRPNAVVLDESGRIFIVGYTMGTLLNSCPSQGERDAFLIAIGPKPTLTSGGSPTSP